LGKPSPLFPASGSFEIGVLFGVCPGIFDLNPIEQSFAKLKALLRKAGARSLHRLSTEIAAALKRFPAAECAAFLAHDGYRQPNRKTL
jgi:hypothetical protein